MFQNVRRMLLVQLKISNRKNAIRPNELIGTPDGIIRELRINRKVKVASSPRLTYGYAVPVCEASP